jgi:hypothetical protein
MAALYFYRSRMDALTFVSKLFEFTAWPVAVVVICIKLKQPLEKLLSRLTSAKHKDTELGFSPEAQNAPKLESNVSVADAIPQDALGLIAEQEAIIYKTLENLKIENAEDKVKVLAKHYANLQIQSEYNQINSTIYNSQLLLLQALNVQATSVELSFFNSYYDAAKNSYPDFYETYSFEAWLNYMKNRGVINTKDEKYFITVLGRGFLMAITEAGVNQKRVY